MREDVDEELPARPQPARDVCQQPLVVLHVLEHLDGDDAVEPAGLDVEAVHVAGDDAEILQAASRRLGVNELLLRPRIRDAGDTSLGKLLGHPQRERTPAAAEFEDVLAVIEPGALGIEREHPLLGLGERGDARRPERAAVFQARAEAELVEARGHLVMLFVRRRRLDGDGRAAQLLDKRLQVRPLRLGAALVLLAQPLRQQATDAEAEERVGEEIAFEEGVNHVRGKPLMDTNGH